MYIYRDEVCEKWLTEEKRKRQSTKKYLQNRVKPEEPKPVKCTLTVREEKNRDKDN